MPTDRTHLPHAVGKEEAYIVAHFPKQGQRLLVVLLRLPTEARNEITAEAHPCQRHGVRLGGAEVLLLGDSQGD